MAEVASAFVSLLPSAKGFGSKLDSQISGDVDKSGKSAGSKFGGALKVAAGAAIGGGLLVGAFAKSAISLEAQFGKTMNVLQATTGAPKQAMKELSDLALKMGADTAFSANDASQAMLELARGGITPAAIQAGALKGTLTLAAAGELDMGEAANTAVKAMGAFNLSGKDMAGIAAALAGGANASSASVRDMSQALAQGGLAAHGVGFSIQETTAVLAAFSNAGLEGADAGTSLKTMLNNLQPSTEKAATAFETLGIFSKETGSKFVKANGEFKSAAQIAELLHKGTMKLTAAERTRALTQAFGTDAQRAATVLATEGAAGLNKLLKATSDTDAAQNMAAANMKGTAGALEALKGSLETVTLKFGLLIAPAVQAGLRLLTTGVNGLLPLMDKIGAAIGPVSDRLSAMFSSGGGGGGFVASLTAMGNSIRANVLPALQMMAATFVTYVLPAVGRLAAYLSTNLVPAFTRYYQILATQVIPIIGTLARFLYGTLVPAVVKIYIAVAQRLKPVFDELFKQIQSSVLPSLRQLLAKFREYQPTIQKVVMVVLKVDGVMLKLAASILGTVLPVAIRLAGFMSRVMIGTLILVVGGIIKVIAALIRFGVALAKGIAAAARFASAVGDKVNSVVHIVAALPGKIAGAIGNLGHLLYSAGAAVIQGLIDGVTSKISALTSKLHAITNLIPKHKGPIDKDKHLLEPAGRAIMDGLIKGLAAKEKALKDKLAAITQKLADVKNAATDFASSVTQNFTSDALSGNLDNFKTTLAADITKAKDFAAALKTAVGKGLSGSLLSAVAASGNVGLAQEIAAQSKTGISDLEKQFAARANAAASPGAFASNQLFGDQIRDQTHEVREQTKELKGIRKDLAAALRKQRAIHVHDKSGDPKRTARDVARREAFAGGS